MKKTYLSPESYLLLAAGEEMLAGSVEGFSEELDNDNSIDVDKMLSRHRRDVWEDEETTGEDF